MTDTTPVTLITGGSSGIGAATARLLLARGHRVVVTGRNADRLDRFAAELGRPDALATVQGHAAELAEVEAAVGVALERFGRLDAAVANAGFGVFDSLAEADPAALSEMVLTNVLGPMLLVRAALPALKETGGRILLVGSVAGFKNTPGNVYSATKWAVTGWAENVRMMVTGDGVGVTLVAPGRVETDFWTPAGGPPEGLKLSPDHIAETIAWAVAQPKGVDVNTVIVRPLGQPH